MQDVPSAADLKVGTIHSQDRAHIVSQNFASDLSAKLLQFEQVANELWQTIDDFSPSQVVQIEETDDPIQIFRSLREAHVQFRDMHRAMLSLMELSATKVNNFGVHVNEFGRHIHASTTSYGFSRIPDELLLHILDDAAESLESTVTLLLVCKRFHSTIIGSQKLWAKLLLSSNYTPRQILTIAERSSFQPLKASILCNGALTESIKAILGLHERFGELCVNGLFRSGAEEMQYYLKNLHMPFLRELTIRNCGNPGYPLFVPGCYTPSLRDLETDFIPHPSLAGTLVRCTLKLNEEFLLQDLLEFVSSANLLRELSLFLKTQLGDQHNAHNLGPISPPSLTSLRFRLEIDRAVVSACRFMEKIVPFSIQKLSFYIGEGHNANELFTIVQANPSIRELQVDTIFHWFEVPIPTHIETLSLVHDTSAQCFIWPKSPGDCKEHHLRLVRMAYIHLLFAVPLLKPFLDAGDGDIQLEVRNCGVPPCRFIRKGTFGLRDLLSAPSLELAFN